MAQFFEIFCCLFRPFFRILFWVKCFCSIVQLEFCWFYLFNAARGKVHNCYNLNNRFVTNLNIILFLYSLLILCYFLILRLIGGIEDYKRQKKKNITFNSFVYVFCIILIHFFFINERLVYWFTFGWLLCVPNAFVL